jgi:hypothetical protein
MEIKDITALLFSRLNDLTCGIQFDKRAKTKGDLILSGRYLIEFALRMYQLKRHVMNQPFEIFLENEWKLNLKSKQLAVEIKESPNIDIPLYKKIKTGIDISVPKSFPC